MDIKANTKDPRPWRVRLKQVMSKYHRRTWKNNIEQPGYLLMVVWLQCLIHSIQLKN